MNYGQINKASITDGPGVRVALYVSGCDFHCNGCHNQEAWDFNFGNKFEQEQINIILKSLSESYISGFSILGGEPLHKNNIQTIIDLLKEVKKLYSKKTIWIWTGFEYDELISLSKINKYYDYILNNADVLVTGRFDLSKRDISKNNKWRGSTNQKIINLKK